MLTRVEDIATGRTLPVRTVDIHMGMGPDERDCIAVIEVLVSELDITTEHVQVTFMTLDPDHAR
jgi:hypothetical protein